MAAEKGPKEITSNTRRDECGTVVEPGTVRFERLLPGPIEQVWEYLTVSEKRGKWLATGDIELEPGGRVELRFRHEDLSPTREQTPERYEQFEGGDSLVGQVIDCQPPRLLSFTWPEGAGRYSEATFELSPRGEMVLLVLTHRLLDDRETMLSVASGWHTHLAILIDRLEGRAPKPFWSAHARFEEEYRRVLAKR